MTGEGDPRFTGGDRAIREKLEELAADRGVVHEGVALVNDEHGGYVYRLRGTTKSISLRAREVRLAADPETMKRRLEPRLEAMFEEVWWQQAVVLMSRQIRW